MLFYAYGYSLTVIFSMDKSVNAFCHIFEGLLLIELIKPLTSYFFGHLGAETSCEQDPVTLSTFSVLPCGVTKIMLTFSIIHKNFFFASPF